MALQRCDNGEDFAAQMGYMSPMHIHGNIGTAAMLWIASYFTQLTKRYWQDWEEISDAETIIRIALSPMRQVQA